METKTKKSFFDKVSDSANSVKSAANDRGITAESIRETGTKIGRTTGNLTVKASKTVGKTLVKTGGSVVSAGSATVEKIREIDFDNYKFDVEDVLRQVMKVPGVKVDREKFLRKELMHHYSETTVNKAISNNPAYAGIERSKIDFISKEVINYETNRVFAISFAAGLPGGFVMAVAIPGDIMQYFVNVVIAMQKISYLYGFDEFELNDYAINDDTFNQIMIFLGVMLGVQNANAGVKIIAELATNKTIKTLPRRALTKGIIYPIVKKITKTLGIKMTKDIFAKSVSKVIPIVGGVVSGGLTYATFKPSCNKLQKNFSQLNISDPDFYKDTVDV